MTGEIAVKCLGSVGILRYIGGMGGAIVYEQKHANMVACTNADLQLNHVPHVFFLVTSPLRASVLCLEHVVRPSPQKLHAVVT